MNMFINKAQSADGNSKRMFSFDFSGRKKSKENERKISNISDPGIQDPPTLSELPESKLSRKGAIKGPGLATALIRRQSKISDVTSPVHTSTPGTKKWAERR